MRAAPSGSAPAQSTIDVPAEFLHAKLHGRRSRLFEGEALRELIRQATPEELRQASQHLNQKVKVLDIRKNAGRREQCEEGSNELLTLAGNGS